MSRHALSAGRSRSVNSDGSWLFPLLFFVVTLVTRIPFRTRFLFDHDAVQLALGMKHYDVYLHQPHPPGYFLYVQTAKSIDRFVGDANVSLVWLSVIASALTVVTLYRLASTLFDRRDGRWVALLTITSPIIWLHGEVASSYIFAAFFAAFIGLIAWKMMHGERGWLYVSPVVLGVAAGFRQDLILFLGPLWLFAVARFGFRATITVLLLLATTLTLWFVPMVSSTGGLDRYFTALRELWSFNNDTLSIWQTTNSTLADTLWTLLGFLFYGVELGTAFLLFSAYLLLRTGNWRTVASSKIWFFTLWLAPALLFYTLIFIPPYKYSYGLVLVPAFVLLIPAAVRFVSTEIAKLDILRNYSLHRAPDVILPFLVLTNLLLFCLTPEGFSVGGLRKHEQILATIFSGIKANFPSENTLILGRQSSTVSGFRHVQYYLPEYSVYLADQQTNRHGEKWHAFGARHGQTILSKSITIGPGVRYLVFVADPYFPETSRDLTQPDIRRIQLTSDYALYYKELESQSTTALPERK